MRNVQHLVAVRCLAVVICVSDWGLNKAGFTMAGQRYIYLYLFCCDFQILNFSQFLENIKKNIVFLGKFRL